MTTYGNRYQYDPYRDYRPQQHLSVVDLDGCWVCPDCRKSAVVVDYTTGDYVCSVSLIAMTATDIEAICVIFFILIACWFLASVGVAYNIQF